MASASEYFEAAEERLSFLQTQAEALERAKADFEADAARAEELLERSWRELGGYLLPEVDDALLTDLEARLSYPGLKPIRDDYAAKISQVNARREALAAMEQVQFTEILVTKIDDQLAEIVDSAEAFRAELDLWASSRWFQTLDASGYFGEGYEPGFFARLRDWRAVSLLMGELEDADEDSLAFDDPEELKDHYRRLLSDSSPVFELEARLKASREEILSLKREHDELLTAPARLHQELYAALVAALRDHLESCPVELRYELAQDDPQLLTFFKKLSGLDKKALYLRELAVTRVGRQLDGLRQQLRKLRGKISRRRAKYNRGRFYSASEAEVLSLRKLKADKWRRRHAKLDKVRRRLNEFDRWEAGSFGEHTLWWDVMTRGAPGDDLYEVRTYHERWAGLSADEHPHARLEAELGLATEDLSSQAAAALAADMLAQGAADAGDDWGLDAS